MPYIQQSIESVMKQTLHDIEIICVDGGSSDGTREFLLSCCKKDSRVQLISSDEKSYGHQINLGIEVASGEYIGIVETDDYIDEEMYWRLYDVAAITGKPDVIKCGFFSLVENKEKLWKTAIFSITASTGDCFSLNDHYSLLEGHPSVWACIYRRDFLEQHKLRMKEVPGGGWVDNLFLFQTMCEAKKISWVNRPLYFYRKERNGSSSQIIDCTIPLDRINDIKDYLEMYYSGDAYLEKALFQRFSDYSYRILSSQHKKMNDIKYIFCTFRRFSLSIMLSSCPWIFKKIYLQIRKGSY